MAQGYVEIVATWQERRLSISYQVNWLNSDHWHIEVRSDERLPITETGYRSIFVSEPDFVSGEDVVAYVIELLDHAATDPAWQRYVAASRQLSLF